MTVSQQVASDGLIDAMATRWQEGSDDRGLVFARNEGGGRFSLRTDLPPGAGDFLQGVATGRFTDVETMQIALSWHSGGRGIELLTVPTDPVEHPWRLERISWISQDEALSAGDIDDDGRVDLLLGTIWLRNAESGWESLEIDPDRAKPDRNLLMDLNDDGLLDAIVGFEAISEPGDVVWYEQVSAPTRRWVRHAIASVVGPMSLGARDMDMDGDQDLIVGEHNMRESHEARLLLFENADGHGSRWVESVIHIGDEHHDGAVPIDIDADGDVDILSIGWSHGKVLLYENLGMRCRDAPSGSR